MNEIWRDIVGFEGKYQISSIGRVKSLARIIGNGKGYLMLEMILKEQYDTDGYPQVTICIGNRKAKSFKIHRLVTTHFIDRKLPEGFHICHRDDNKLNNNVSNLYIGDVITNTIDKYNNGTTKLSIEQIREIRLLNGKKPQWQIAETFGVRQGTISRIMNGVRNRMIV